VPETIENNIAIISPNPEQAHNKEMLKEHHQLS
jgi:hypothetical protein